MRVTKTTLQNMVNRLNAEHGFENVGWDTVGAYRLYSDGIGYAIHRVNNAAGGVECIGNMAGMTTKECYYFLCGVLARV